MVYACIQKTGTYRYVKQWRIIFRLSRTKSMFSFQLLPLLDFCSSLRKLLVLNLVFLISQRTFGLFNFLHVVTHLWKLQCYHVVLVGYGPLCPNFSKITNHQSLWKRYSDLVDFLHLVFCILLEIH